MGMGSDKTIFIVIIGQENEFTIWPQDKEIPVGWKSVGQPGTKEECKDYIQEVWTDPLPNMAEIMDEVLSDKDE